MYCSNKKKKEFDAPSHTVTICIDYDHILSVSVAWAIYKCTDPFWDIPVAGYHSVTLFSRCHFWSMVFSPFKATSLQTFHCVIVSILRMKKDVNDSPAGAFFGQDVRELGPSTALHCGIRNIHVDKASDLGNVTKSILYDHHVVAGTWRAEERNRLV